MQIISYDLEGQPSAVVEIDKDPLATLLVNGEPTLAVSLWRTFVALTLQDRIVLIRTRDFCRVSGYASLLALGGHDF